jgi:hypothetical protein
MQQECESLAEQELYEVQLALETVASMLTAANYAQALHILQELLLAATTDDVFVDADTVLIADLLLTQPVLLAGLQDALRCPGTHTHLALSVVCMLAQQATDPQASYVLCVNFVNPMLRLAVTQLAADPMWPGLCAVADFFLAVCCEQACFLVTKGCLPFFLAWTVKSTEASHAALASFLALLLSLLTDGDVTDLAASDPATLAVNAAQIQLFGRWLDGVLRLPVCVAHKVRNVVLALQHALKRTLQHMERGSCDRARALAALASAAAAVSADSALHNPHLDTAALLAAANTLAASERMEVAPTATPPARMSTLVPDTRAVVAPLVPWTPQAHADMVPSLTPSTPSKPRRCPDAVLSSPVGQLSSPCGAQKRKGSELANDGEHQKHLKMGCFV